jgi:nucleoside-diphosphate-sugar epimerase
MAIPPSNGKTVLITGINGYIASVLGLALLERGYTLRGTSRRIASSERLLKGPYAPYVDRVKIYEVSDMTIDGAFDEASKGLHSMSWF